MPTYTALTRTLTAKPRSKRRQQGAVPVTQQLQGGSATVGGNYLPAIVDDNNIYEVGDQTRFTQSVHLGPANAGIDIEYDAVSNAVHIAGGLYTDGFISALGLNPDAPAPSGGLDEDELWQILGGSSTNHHILPTYLDSVPWASLTGKPSWIGSSKPSYTKSEVGLGNVDNTADVNKSVYGVIDYGGNNTIRIGYVGSGLTSSNLTHIAGYTDNGTKIKDVSKSVLKEWLNYTTTDIGALPLSGGTMTGSLVIATGVGISDASTNGMLVYKPTGWTGISSSQWGVGAIDCAGVIRTSGNNLYHYKNDTQSSHLILDANNYNSYVPTKTGTGASGTWEISVSGKSGSLSVPRTTTSTNANGFLSTNTFSINEYQTLTNSPNDSYPWWNIISYDGGDGNYGTQISNNLFSERGFWYRQKIGGTFNSWSKILDSSNYSSYALPLTGGTMTGVLTLKANQYSGANGYGMNCNNSDLFNVNSIITADNAESFGEGIMFWRSSTPTYDCLTASGGTFYFGSNKTYGAALSGDADISCGSIYSHNYVFLNSNNSGIYLSSNSISWHNSSNNFITNLLVFDANGYTHYLHHLMLDGANASSSTANTTQIVFNASNTQQVALTSNANALIINPTTSSTTGQIVLGVNGKSSYFTSTGNFGIGNNSPSYKLHVSGNIYATGAVTAGATSSSDRRLKTDIKEFDALSIIDKLQPKSFKWNNVAKKLDSAFDNDDTQYGLIAQEVADVMPSLAFKFTHNEYMGVRYEKLIPILLKAIKELQDEINKLKK